MPSTNGEMIGERLAASLEAAAEYNANDAVRPVAVLWTDGAGLWHPVIPPLSTLMPHLLTLGDYDPATNTGPAIWLRCVVDGAVSIPSIAPDVIPVLYLPGVGRQEIGAAETCPAHLRPLVELQYRGVCWTQKNGKDWTVEAFLGSKDGGLGLDVARDVATRRAMSTALAELASTPVAALAGRRLEAEDFHRLLSNDLARDVLVWLNAPQGTKAAWDAQRWEAFVSRCKAELGFHPDGDGVVEAAGRLGKREASWDAVWRRFEEAPSLYPDLPALLRQAQPDLLAEPRSSWPQCNEEDETALRVALVDVQDMPAAAARNAILELERIHAERRDSPWARLEQAPLAAALKHLAQVAERTASELGGVSPEDLAQRYAKDGWRTDLTALDSMAAVKSNADMQAVGGALHAIYGPWLEAAARHLQGLAEQMPLGTDEPGGANLSAQPGTVFLFADGLRFDVSQRLVGRLEAAGHAVDVSTRWAALPSVTATAKPACSPIAHELEGGTIGVDFQPDVSATKQPLSTDRFRKLLNAAGIQHLAADATGDPSGMAWTEDGKLDKLGHSEQAKLAAHVSEQIDLLVERITVLLEAGWREVRVVTDHGWLWLPGGLPKVELPRYLVTTRWSRCAIVAGASQVQVPTMPWHWNAHERVAVGPGIACFVANNAYAHGGLSLQECLVPALGVRRGAGRGAAPSITHLAWTGLRCRVRVEAALGYSVALRTQVGNADSTIVQPKPLEDEGTASLLVADDELEGATAAIVVLDANGEVVARQSTIVGGEDGA